MNDNIQFSTEFLTELKSEVKEINKQRKIEIVKFEKEKRRTEYEVERKAKIEEMGSEELVEFISDEIDSQVNGDPVILKDLYGRGKDIENVVVAISDKLAKITTGQIICEGKELAEFYRILNSAEGQTKKLKALAKKALVEKIESGEIGENFQVGDYEYDVETKVSDVFDSKTWKANNTAEYNRLKSTYYRPTVKTKIKVKQISEYI